MGVHGAWSQAPIRTVENVLNGVAAVSSNDVWAVGFWVDGLQRRTLAEHWDGTSWTVVSTPYPGFHGHSTAYLRCRAMMCGLWVLLTINL